MNKTGHENNSRDTRQVRGENCHLMHLQLFLPESETSDLEQHTILEAMLLYLFIIQNDR